MRTGADGARPPKYSLVERERRWLVDPAALPPLPHRHVLVEDRYLTGTRLRLRRMTDSGGDSVTFKLAKKYEAADPAARPMVNAYLDDAEFAVFAGLPASAVRKRRFVVDGFSVDLFEGGLAPLVLAEREAADAPALAALRPPPWVRREVTHDPRFQGGALARLDAEGILALLRDAAP